MTKKPVGIFAWRRPAQFRNCVQSIASNPEAPQTPLYVFIDGPRSSSDQAEVAKTISEANQITGFKSIEILICQKNVGLADSILSGVKHVLQKEICGIFLEDDLVVSPFFLKYMNEAIELYLDNPKVSSVHGYVYPTEINLSETFFMKGADCWGWATWRSAWAHFEPDGRKLLRQIQTKGLDKEFDLGGFAGFTAMLKAQIAGKNNSWAIRWHASAFLDGLHALYPGRSLVQNTGFDSSGTHCETTNRFSSSLSPNPIQVKPIPVEESSIGRKAFREFFLSQQKNRQKNQNS